jgi:hypothetical protein
LTYGPTIPEPIMATITFPDIHVRVAAHHAASATRNAPKPAAIRAVYQLGSLLADLNADDRAAVLALLREEVPCLAATVWR